MMTIGKKATMRLFMSFAIIAIMGTSIYAQQARGNGTGNGKGTGYGPGLNQNDRAPFACLTNLTDDQKAKLETEWIKHREANQAIRLDIAEKEIQLRRLELEDKPDQKAIDQKIDEIYTLKATMAKNRNKFHSDAAEYLTDDQLKQLKLHRMHKGHGKHSPHAKGIKGNGTGMCRAMN